MEQLLSIGEFAEQSGLSRSALRFYDQNDLLRPRLVDAQSGYRYYGPEQLRQALLVRRLRAAEMPVGTLREYLVAPVERQRVILEEHVLGFRQRALSVEAAVGELRGELGQEDPVPTFRGCSIDPALFASALGQVGFAVADPMVRVDLGAIWVETKEGSLRLVATDSYRLAVRDLVPLEFGSGGIRGVIDAEHVPVVAAALATANSLLLSQSGLGAITATIDGRVLTVGGIGEDFPDYEGILCGTTVSHQIALTRDDIERALIDLPTDTEYLILSFDEHGLGIQASGEHRTVVGEWSGPALQMFFDPRFLADAVRATVGPDLVIEASDPLQPITLRSADTGTFSVLTMPIRQPAL
jgi:DNA-binding transcriptional MerR regulator